MDDAKVALLLERMVAVSDRKGPDGAPELYLTIENSIEERAQAYLRLLRTRQVLKKARSGE